MAGDRPGRATRTIRRLAAPGWWRRRSLRFRLTATASALLVLGLAASACVLLGVLGFTLINTADEAAYQQAREVVALADAGRLPDPVRAPGGTIVQVVDSAGRITQATPNTDRLVPLLDAESRAAAPRDSGLRGRLLDGRPYGIPEPLWVVALPADHGTDVIVARSIGEIEKSLSTTAHLLIIGTPLLTVLLAAASWLIIGSTLRPITALRRGAADIGGADPSRRLPVPESRDEVHSLAVTLNDMLARLEQAGARQRALVSDAAHELRSPLASIRLQLEVALGHPDRQDWRETAEGVLEDTLRLARLAEDLLALSRLDERGGAAPARSEPVDLGDLVAHTAERYGEARVAVTVVSAAQPGEAVVRGDAVDLGRVLTNLIDNAVRHAASTVEVRVAAPATGSASRGLSRGLFRGPGDTGPVGPDDAGPDGAMRDGADGVDGAAGPMAVITVTDDGPGIPAADRERVFDRFTRLDAARSRDEGGTGLGLAIVRETVRAHGGTVHLEDAGHAGGTGRPEDAGPGLRAVVRLPLYRPPAGQGGAERPGRSGRRSPLGDRQEVLRGGREAAPGVDDGDDTT